jgi:hypothetical protein
LQTTGQVNPYFVTRERQSGRFSEMKWRRQWKLCAAFCRKLQANSFWPGGIFRSFDFVLPGAPASRQLFYGLAALQKSRRDGGAPGKKLICVGQVRGLNDP